MPHPPSKLRWFFLASAILAGAVAWGLALPLAGGAVLAFVSEIPIDFALRKLRRERSTRLRWVLAVSFVFLIVAGLLLPLTLAAISAVRELVALLSAVEWDRVGEWGTGSLDWLRRRASDYGLDIPESEVSGRFRSALAESFSFLGARLGDLVRSTPSVLFEVLIFLISWVVFAVEGPHARDKVLRHLVPWDKERDILRKTTAEVLRSVLVANVIVSIAQATVCSVALIILQIPRALVWGTLSFFLSFVPVVGTMPVTFGAAIYCYSQGRVGAAVFMVAIAAVIGLIDNILRPIFMKSSANLSFFWTFIAFVGGVALFGLPGVIIGPLAFSLFVAYLRAMEILSPKKDDEENTRREQPDTDLPEEPPAPVEAPETFSEPDRAPPEVPETPSEPDRAPPEVPETSSESDRAPAEVPETFSEPDRAPPEVPETSSESDRAPPEVPETPSETDRAPAEVPETPSAAVPKPKPPKKQQR